MAKRERLSAAEWICSGIGVASYIDISGMGPKRAPEVHPWVEWLVIGGLLCLITVMAAFATRRPTALAAGASRGWYVVAFVPWLASAVAGTIVLMIAPAMLWDIVAIHTMMFWVGVSLALGIRRRRAEARATFASMRVEASLD